MNFTIEREQEVDRRCIAEISDLPGVIVYGVSPAQAAAKAKAPALRVIADRMDNEESLPGINHIAFSAHEHVAVH